VNPTQNVATAANAHLHRRPARAANPRKVAAAAARVAAERPYVSPGRARVSDPPYTSTPTNVKAVRTT
jgi:hypothetical protein